MESDANGRLSKADEVATTDPEVHDALLKNLDPDKLLAQMGKGCNIRQVVYLTLINLCWVLFAFQTLVFAFIGDVPSHQCVHESTLNDTSAFPFHNENRSSTVKQCHWEGEYEQQKCGANGTRFLYGHQFGYTMAVEWDLICDRLHLTQLPSSVYQIGAAVSMILVTQLSDAFGRKLVFTVGFWMGALCGIAAALAPNIYVFAGIRFVTGVFSVTLSCVSWVYSTEMVSPQWRGVMPLYMNVIWNIGYMAVGILAMYVTNWRTLYMVMSVPFVLTVAYHWCLPESLHWLVAKNKVNAVHDWLRVIERTQHGVDLLAAQKVTPTNTDSMPQHTAHKRTLIDAFKSPVLLFYLVVFSFLAITASIVYWGLSLFSTQLSHDRFIGFFLSGLIEIPAGIIGPILLFWFGRRTISVLSYGLSGLALFALIFVPDKDHPSGDDYTTARITLSLIGKFGNMVVFSSAYLLMPETMPTTLRNVCYGVIMCVGKIGSIIAPYCGILSTINAALPPAIFGVLSSLAALLCLTLPETFGRELPEDIADVDPGPFLTLFSKKLRKRRQKLYETDVTLDATSADADHTTHTLLNG